MSQSNLSPKSASEFTKHLNNQVQQALPLADDDDWIRNDTGLIAREESLVVTSDVDPSRTVWDMDRFAFIETECPDTVNPSLWRQEQLTNRHGLFQLNEHIFQVRGYDISNITFVRSDTGWIVIDPLTSTETARRAFEFLTRHLGKRPVQAVIYTHSHADHFAGVLGVTSFDAVERGEVAVIAPAGFLEEAVRENVIAGPAMLRRASYMYGGQLPASPQGVVGSGLGRSLPRGGQSGLIAPTDSITRSGDTREIDGVKIVFQLTPNSEAPAEMHFWFPQFNALCMAENCTCVMHNLYTLRGAHIRDALAWSKYIHEALLEFGDNADLCFASHNWPVWGSEHIKRYLTEQRDTYRFIHDQTMRLANTGLTSTEIAEELELPASLAKCFNNRGYYGTVSHNAKAVYQKYLGWFDGNPANLNPHPPVESATRYVEFMGGADAVLEKARASFAAGDYRWVVQVVNHVVFDDPSNVDARQLQADALEQLGYQSESGPWRNFYLTGAQELRSADAQQSSAANGSPIAMMRQMPLEMIFDALGVRLNGQRADGLDIRINWSFTDLAEQWVVGLQHGALHSHRGVDLAADASIVTTHKTLVEVLAQVLPATEAVASGALTIDGSADALISFFGLLEQPSGHFAIVTP